MDTEELKKEGYFNTHSNDFKLNLVNIHYAYKIYYYSLFNNELTFKKLYNIYNQNEDYTDYLLNAVINTKKRFDEIEDILKTLNLRYLLVYTKDDREEMKKNGSKYDIILDSLIGRPGVLLEFIKQNQYIKKYNFIEKYIGLICIQNESKDEIIFLYGETEPDLIKNIVLDFLKR